MRNPLFASLGIFSISYFPQLPSFWLLLFVAIFTGVLFYKKYLAPACLLLGCIYGSIYGYYLLEQMLPEELNQHTFMVEGRVTGLPQHGVANQRFHLHITDITVETGSVTALQNMQGKKIALSWRKNQAIQKEKGSAPNVHSGDIWRLNVKLRRPRGFVNPGGFDYQLYLLQNNVMATGYVRENAQNMLLLNDCRFYSFDCLREKISKKLANKYQDSVELGLILGLLVGDKQLITPEQWTLFKNTGTIHLLAISGLHIGLAALLGGLLGQFLMRMWQLFCGLISPALMNKLCFLPSFLSVCFALFYSALAGFSLPTQRALVVVLVFHFFSLCYRNVSAWTMLTIAALAVAVIDPLSVCSAGFWLSFMAVVLLLFAFSFYVIPPMESLNKNYLTWALLFKKKGSSLINAQVVLMLGLLLPGVLWMQGISVSSPIANLVAVPLVSFVTVPLLLISLILLPIFPQLTFSLINLAKLSLDYLLTYLRYVEHTIGGFWYADIGEMSWLAILCVIVGTVWLFLPKGFPYRYLSLVCFLPIFLPLREFPELSLTFLDVGQGTAVVVETPRHTLVYDTGKHFSERFDSGQHIIAPYLLYKSRKHIDYLITSHGDNDHAGGVSGLLSVVTLDKHLSGEATKTSGEQCQAGQFWRWDDVDFLTLWPSDTTIDAHKQGKSKSNHQSCVLLIQYKTYRFLLTGDIESVNERELLALYPEKLRNLSVLLIPHHGSRTSSHQQWVDYLNADYGVVTAGYTNAYNHPHPNVVERYQQVGTKLEQTSNSGALIFKLVDGPFKNQKELSITRWREQSKRYWYN